MATAGAAPAGMAGLVADGPKNGANWAMSLAPGGVPVVPAAEVQSAPLVQSVPVLFQVKVVWAGAAWAADRASRAARANRRAGAVLCEGVIPSLHLVQKG